MSQRLKRSTTPAILVFALVFASCAAATYDTHDDATVSTQVKIALIDDARLGSFRINAVTSHGVVTLEGSVPSQADADHAVAVARKVRGVKDVKSDLVVGSGSVDGRLFACI